MDTVVTPVRLAVLGRLARGIAARAAAVHVLRVAVDGPFGAGKSTFTRALDDALRPHLPPGREVRRFDTDMYMIRGRVHRAPAAADPQWLYDNVYDLGKVRAVAEGPAYGPPAVVLVDGMGLQRPELADLWDLVLYLHVPEKVTLDRMRARRAELEADGMDLEPLYRDRYLPVARLYQQQVDPAARADVLVDMHDADQPVVVRWGGL
ncbi:hypothetical protein MF406_01745 [Georgenia sp. TF02-10]|uniref:AAA family ATPase n=1 Tax=Georgenia sp. TF02-10 TaxID=2917725 RepID=UPI001FA755A2|nr:hypothetical protein [Georgenia sp. TF02-10]UNX55035.1 hypothetical protein MF406_01745 [Georgenia sp. TF02-10]